MPFQTHRSFTLIEIMVVLVLCSLVAGLMYSIFSRGFADSDENLAVFTSLQFEALIKILKKDVRSIHKVDSVAVDPDGCSLSFMTSVLGRNRLPENFRIVYSWKDPYRILRKKTSEKTSQSEEKLFDFRRILEEFGGKMDFRMGLKNDHILECSIRTSNRKNTTVAELAQQISLTAEN